MNLPNLDTSRIVAIICFFALLGAWTYGMASLPGGGKPTSTGQGLPAIKAFAPPQGYVGSHTYGLWTLTCGKASDEAPSPGVDIPRCRTQGLINARRQDNKVISLVAMRVVRAGPQEAPYIIIHIPLKSKGDGTILFAVDENNAFRAPIKECTETTCKIEAPLPAEALNQMLKGQTLRLQMNAGTAAQPAKLVYPLHGFRESFDALTAVEIAG